MKRAQVATPWVAANPNGTTLKARSNHPKLVDDYTIKRWTDVTCQPAASLPPTPNLLVIEIVCDDAVFAAIAADPAYADGILWSEDA